jgi:hypothetical protein
VVLPLRGRVLLIVMTGVALAACSNTPHRNVVSGAAVAFVADLERGDGAAACAMLTSDARTAVSGATDASCAKAITSVKEQGRTVSAVQVWGDAAQVKVGGDVVFLRRMSAGWQVSAAGCQSQPSGPYECKVGG